jgi:ADP-heptose:LPS heptosyltransferase
MNRFAYRYRLIHAFFERILTFITRLFPASKENLLFHPPQKVLILKFGGMGEAVLARSLMERLRERNPQISIDYLVEKRTVETMTCGSTGRIFMYSPSSDGLTMAFKTLLAIRKQRYDAIVDFEQHSLLTAVFVRAAASPVRVGFVPSQPNHRGRMFTHSIQLREGESMWDAFIQLGRILDPGLPRSLMTVPLPLCKASEDWLSDWWTSHVQFGSDGPVVAMHLGVGPSAQYRRWPMERFVELAVAMSEIQPKLTVLLTGGGNERLLMAAFRKQFAGKVVEAGDLGGLDRTCALLKRCDLLVSADTGIMHLAAAMAVPTVGLFGPNTPACWAPVGVQATYVYATSRACSPCINSYRRYIPEKCTAEKEGACMWDISVHDVLAAARRVIRDSWLS